MKPSSRELTKHIIENGILKFGDFTLKSGKKSWFYIDLRLIPSYPDTFNLAIRCFKVLLDKIDECDAVAGVAVGGIPFSSVIGYKLKIPSLVVRTHQKDYGLKKKIEGIAKAGAKIVLVDDLITTGSSKIPGILALREKGFILKNMVVLIDRSQGNLGQIEEIGVKLHSFVTIEDIFNECLSLDDKLVLSEVKETIKKNL
ncbi:MAG: orotate phosphoribosyltransferase [Candidatus Heimdallarchaeota archaeon]|nr:MAG: orotate phosphoribosyltransferase [Candidatus Heimdallarchaeota archaeon]